MLNAELFSLVYKNTEADSLLSASMEKYEKENPLILLAAFADEVCGAKGSHDGDASAEGSSGILVASLAMAGNARETTVGPFVFWLSATLEQTTLCKRCHAQSEDDGDCQC